MLKKKYISIIIIQFVIVLTLVLNINNQKKDLDNNLEIVKKSHDTISMMLETEAGSGNYEMTTRDSWPTEGYIFNSTLSKCENGGELLWDDTTKKVVFNGATSDKCYVYFDVKSNPTFTIIDLDSTEKTYTFEEGMTWKNWLESTYNTDGYYITKARITNSKLYTSEYVLCDSNGDNITGTEKMIIENNKYYACVMMI